MVLLPRGLTTVSAKLSSEDKAADFPISPRSYTHEEASGLSGAALGLVSSN